MKERMKTVSVALVLCLNVGVDPPDVVKIQPCARLECWIDPSSVAPQKALELIGASLQRQYERWQPRARYKQSLDPTVEDVKKLCTSLRRNAKEERVLFHYNGHGVPRPTVNGEIWVFNKTYTQYIPLSIYDLQKWMGAPSIYVYDCSNAGIIVNSFHTFAETHEKEAEMRKNAAGTANPNEPPQPPVDANRVGGESPTPPATTYKNCIQLAACSENQILPMNPQLPADLFTACLTTPIKIAIKWYTLQTKTKLLPHVSEENIDKIPGMLNDRRTMLGELNWIFTAITDTIAWNTLPKELFQRLFRQDLLVASLFRNFLLAERILKSYDCTPVSSPALPQCYRHPMWLAWDLALDMALTQLPDILDKGKPYQHSSFFEEQLTAFQVWLEESLKERSPPEQLPIVLQVLLSQVHRLRALELLGHFLDLGPWAVNLALSVGIFPYVLKLLQSSAKELRPILVFIWAKILAVDASRQVDIIRDQGHKFFLSALQETAASNTFFKGDHRVYAAFVLASIVHNFPLGQSTALQGQLLSICLVQIDDENPLLRQWLAITLGHLWQNYEQAKWSGVRDLANEKLFNLLSDPVPEVRAAAVYALGTFISSVVHRTEHADNIDRLTAMELLSAASNDMSPVVRMELVAALQWMVVMFETQFINVFLLQQESTKEKLVCINSKRHTTGSLERHMKMPRVASSNSIINVGKNSFGSVYLKLWNGLNALSKDPHPGVAVKAMKIVDYVKNQEVITIQAQEATTEKCLSTSVSLPPSPNTRLINYLSESPPVHSSLHLNAHTTPLATKHKFSPLNKSGELSQSNKDHSDHQNSASSSQQQEPNQTALKSIITTSYIEESVAYFARPSKQKNDNAKDMNCNDYLEQQPAWIRSQIAQDEGRQQQRRADMYGRFNSQIWSCRTNHTPTLVKLHPFDNQIVVAYKDRVMLHDWTVDVKSAFLPEIVKTSRLDQKTPTPTNPSITVTSLEFVNVKDGGVLVMAGYNDSSIRLWRPGDGINEAALVTAWQGLLDLNTPPSSKIMTELGLVTAWHQQSQTIMAAGESKYVRLWDAERESKICDIPTGSDTAVTKLSCAPNGIFAAGCVDGTVRLFDKRCSPTEARFTTFREHLNSIFTICLRDDCEYLISACTTCNVKLFDIRKNNGSYLTWNAGSDVTAISIHTSADIIACASSSITIYGMDGTNLNTIRCNEGFMGTKYGLISCLSFHRYKINIAAGFVNNSACVFASK